jgi:serine/threonine-protein kinase HipA
MNELIVLLDGREAGTVTRNKGKLSFAYTNSWRESPSAFPLSLSMPLAARDHAHSAIEPFIWGLLPDNDQVLSRWGRKFQVSPRSAFELIGHVGEDCAGTVQFVRPEKLDDILDAELPEPDWLSEAEVASRLRTVRTDASAGRLPGDRGQFSLAGAQPKTSLLFFQNRWGVTSGRTPTTHILKPASAELDGYAENEHLCLRLASALGLVTTESHVQYFEDVPTIVVKRYDRLVISEAAVVRKSHAVNLLAQAATLRTTGNQKTATEAEGIEAEAKDDFALADQLLELANSVFVGRTHQEDFCQALKIHPVQKYQNQGGPGPIEIVQTLRSNVSSHKQAKENKKFQFAGDDDIWTFTEALIFNWLIGGTDAHAKNYSLLIGGGGMVRLAPLYDISSILAYPNIVAPEKAKLAMKIGDEYRLRYIGLSDWQKLAATIGVDSEALIERLQTMAKELPDRLSDEVIQMNRAGLNHSVIQTLSSILTERAAKISAM